MLNAINQTRQYKYRMIPFLEGTYREVRLRKEWYLPGAGRRRSRSTGKKFQLCKISSGDQLYNIGPRVNNNVLFTKKFVRRVDLMLNVLQHQQ